MNKETPSKINLFLIELILAIVFFVVISVIVMNVFTSSKELAVKTEGLNGAIIVAQSNAEVFSTVASEGLEQYNNKTVYYDKNWVETTIASDYKYSVVITVEKSEDKAGTMYYFHQKICSYNNDETIFALNSQRYIDK